MGIDTTNRDARIGLNQSTLTTCRRNQSDGYNERRSPVILAFPMICSIRFGPTKNRSLKTSIAYTNKSTTKPEAEHTHINKRSLFGQKITKQLHAKELYKNRLKTAAFHNRSLDS